jgi:hypothetical protein
MGMRRWRLEEWHAGDSQLADRRAGLRRGTFLLVVMVAAVAVSACTSGGISQRSTNSHRTPGAVTYGSQGLEKMSGAGRITCDAAHVDSVVDDFVTAFNSGDPDSVSSYVATSGAGYQWFTFGRHTLRNPAELTSFVRAQHFDGVRMSALSVHFNGANGQYGNFQLSVQMGVTGRQVTFDGKGATWCDVTGGSIFVWAMVSR